AFPGIYPQASWADLERDQRAVDQGHHPLWTTPEGVAAEFAVAVLGWDPADVVTERNTRQDVGASVFVTDRSSPGAGGATVVQLEQLGRTGEGGVWTVTSVTGWGIAVERPQPWAAVAPDEPFPVAGRVDPSVEAVSVRARLYDALLDPPLAEAEASSGGDRFQVDLLPPSTGDGVLVLLVEAVGDRGRVRSATALPLRSTEEAGATDVPRLEPQAGLPDAVAEKRQAIFVAAAAGDLDALAGLADPRMFTFSFGADDDPARYWRTLERAGGEGPRDVIPALLNASYGTLDAEGGTVYVWPSAAAMRNPAGLTEEQRDELRALGYSEREIRVVEDGGFFGWRLGITEDGRWIFFVAGD
ncbi:MAG TPA: hypothetical protein VNO17_10985, partial [Actinomycetota bacterium]|nr:hypothetical protein [Actinomycetota bacterium]